MKFGRWWALSLPFAAFTAFTACTSTFNGAHPGGDDGGNDATSEESSVINVPKADASDGTIGDAGPSGCSGNQLACDGGCVDDGVLNCGACGHDCSNLKNVTGTVTCGTSGQCSFPLSSCAAGWTHCSSNPDQGCETDITKPSNCGACGNSCPTAKPVCADAGSGYACIACSAPKPTPCSGSCVDVTTDGSNCGSCAHDCLGGQCVGGVCQPITLASGLVEPQVIAAGSTGVYWAGFVGDAGAQTMTRSDPDGGNQTTLATTAGFVTGIAVNSTDVYWSDESVGVEKCAVGGCGGKPTLVAPGQPKGVVLDSTHVYWIEGNPGFGRSCPLSGCPTGADGGIDPATLFSENQAQNIAVDPSSIYWSGPYGVFKCPLTGCPTVDGGEAFTTLGAPGGNYGVSVDLVNVYWGTPTGLMECRVTGCVTPVLLGPSTEAFNTATDGINVYWTDSSAGAIDRCAISGCNSMPTVMASSPQPAGLALDATSIYWASFSGGTVMRLAK